MLNITEVKIKKIDKGNFLGYASLLIDNGFIVDGIELYEGKNGRYVLMPLNPKTKKNKKNSAYPISDETRKEILNLVSEKYNEID